MGWQIKSCQSRRPTRILKVKMQRMAGSRQESCRRALDTVRGLELNSVVRALD